MMTHEDVGAPGHAGQSEQQATAETVAPSAQMTDIYGVACDVHPTRTFRDGRQLGAGYDLSAPSTWFVYDRENRDSKWHKHCGPYSTFDQAKQWALDIREERGR